LQRDGLSEVHFELGVLPIRARTDQALAGASASIDGDVSILLRPDDVIHDDASPLQAEVVARRSGARSSCTRCACPAARNCWRWCPAITTTRWANGSESASMPTMS
jgi:hypothetical protein